MGDAVGFRLGLYIAIPGVVRLTRIIHSVAVHNPETADLLKVIALARIFLGQHTVNMFPSKNPSPPRLFKSLSVFPLYPVNKAG